MTTPLLEMVHISKRFGAVEALRDADFTVHEQEVVALMGDNGAGKSTLVKTLCGVHRPDAGEIRFEGRTVQVPSPQAAKNLGIETVFQDLALAPDLDTAGNLFLGREPLRTGPAGRLGLIDKRQMRAASSTILERLEVRIKDIDAPVAQLSGGQQQSVAVARAANWASKLVVMDEPTAALGVAQTQAVLDLIVRVKESGRAVVLISHSLPEVMQVSDRIEVLRLGARVATLTTADVAAADVVAAMTGADTQELQ